MNETTTTTVTTTTRRIIKAPKPAPRLIHRTRKIVIRTRTASMKGAKANVRRAVEAVPVRVETVVTPRELPAPRKVLNLPASAVRVRPGRSD